MLRSMVLCCGLVTTIYFPTSFSSETIPNVVDINEGKSFTPQGLPLKNGTRSLNGGASSEAGIQAGSPPSLQEVTPNFIAAAATCTAWWVSGTHRWSWSGVPAVYTKRYFWGRTNTFYGSPTDPDACGRPALIVDRIRVHGFTNPEGSTTRLTIDNTAYNASYVEASSSKSRVGGNAMTGAFVTHIAEKNGIEWNTISRSGQQ